MQRNCNAEKKLKLHIPSRRWNSQILWLRAASENIHFNPGASDEEENEAIFKENQINYILQPYSNKNQRAVRKKLIITSGPLQVNLYLVITWNPEFKLYMPREESFLIPMKYVDVTRTTQTSLDALLEKIMITGTWMEKKNDQIHGQASQDSFFF